MAEFKSIQKSYKECEHINRNFCYLDVYLTYENVFYFKLISMLYFNELHLHALECMFSIFFYVNDILN